MYRHQVTRSYDHNILCIDILQILYRLRNHRWFLLSFARLVAGLYVFYYEWDGVVLYAILLPLLLHGLVVVPRTRSIHRPQPSVISLVSRRRIYIRTPVRTNLTLDNYTQLKSKNHTPVFLIYCCNTVKWVSELLRRIPLPRKCYRSKTTCIR